MVSCDHGVPMYRGVYDIPDQPVKARGVREYQRVGADRGFCAIVHAEMSEFYDRDFVVIGSGVQVKLDLEAVEGSGDDWFQFKNGKEEKLTLEFVKAKIRGESAAP